MNKELIYYGNIYTFQKGFRGTSYNGTVFDPEGLCNTLRTDSIPNILIKEVVETSEVSDNTEMR